MSIKLRGVLLLALIAVLLWVSYPASQVPIPSTATVPPTPSPVSILLSTPASTATPTVIPTPLLTSLPTVLPTTILSPTLIWNKLYTATTIAEWPAWCVKPGDDGKPHIQLSPLQVEDFCFNQASNRVLANFAVEWTVRIEAGSALLMFGQNNTFYRLEVKPGEGTLAVREVRDFVRDKEQNLGDVQALTLRPTASDLNTIKLARLGSTITLSVNGEPVKIFPDTLFGDHTPIMVGIGAVVEGEVGAVIYLEALNVYVPTKE